MTLRHTVITLAGVSLLLAFVWFVRQLSFVALGLSAHDEVQSQLRASLADQKKLARLDRPGAAAYRTRFQTIERLLLHLGVLEHSRAQLMRRMETAIIAGVAIVLIGGVTAGVASRRLRDRQRLQSVEHLAAWQDAARRHAHEIRTPLTAAQMEIDRLAALVERGAAAGEIRQVRRSIHEELERLRSFTQSFTSFATVAVPRVVEIDAADLLAEFCATFAHAWPALRLVFDRPAQHCPLFADRALLRQVLVNLCTNSAMAGAKEVRFSIHRSATMVHVNVADDGPGIEPAVRRRIFEPYTTTRPVGEGMGLGLAISKKILLDHGGDLVLLDRPRGAAFRLTLASAESAA
jgi:signal transduction histidine kinase